MTIEATRTPSEKYFWDSVEAGLIDNAIISWELTQSADYTRTEMIAYLVTAGVSEADAETYARSVMIDILEAFGVEKENN